MPDRAQSPEDEARDVVERMAALRRELVHDVEQIAESTQAMTDWTFYVRRFPWAAVGVAAAAGFLLVPRKKTTVTPTPEQLAALANSKEFVAAATNQLKPPESVFKGIAATLAAMAGRAALSYITEQIRVKAAASVHSEPTTARTSNGKNYPSTEY